MMEGTAPAALPLGQRSPSQDTLEAALLGDHPTIVGARQLIATLAPLSEPVWISGETGTGKGIAARLLHQLSPRRARPMAIVHLAPMDQQHASDALFGHVPGAYTGATGKRDGALLQARDSTLFVDEAQSMPRELQSLFALVPETGSFKPMGSDQSVHTNARLVCASNVGMDAEIAAGRFGGDIFERLSVYRIELPPLRHHRGDIPIYVRQVLAEAGRPPEAVSDAGMRVLMTYDGPRNVRELRNTLLRAIATAGPWSVDETLLRRWLPAGRLHSQSFTGASHDFARDTLQEALVATGWNLSAVAQRLGCSRPTLAIRARELGVSTSPPPGVRRRRRARRLAGDVSRSSG